MNQTKKPNVKIIDINDTSEALALRSVLEYWNIKVDYDTVATANQLVEVVNSLDFSQKLVFVMSHGDGVGFVLPELGSEFALKQKFIDHITPINIKNNLQFNEQILISSACKTGNTDFANAFIESGVSTYIAPTSYPEGSHSLKFCIDFTYAYLVENRNLDDIYNIINFGKNDDEFKMFTNK